MSLFLRTISPLSISAIVKNVVVLATPLALVARVGTNLSLLAPGAEKLVDPVELSKRDTSWFESIIDSRVSKPMLTFANVSYLDATVPWGVT